MELGLGGPIPTGVSTLPVGLPSDLLGADLTSAGPSDRSPRKQRIGVATSDLFPKFSLTGSTGLQSEKFKDLGNSESIFYNFGPSFRWNLFDAGKIRSNIAVQNAKEDQQLVIYSRRC